MTSLLIAIQFLTRWPVRLDKAPSARQMGRSLLHYPLVGLLLGTLLWCAQYLSGGVPVLLQGALLLVLWIAMTGALHLDGLADMADAWAGGMGSRDRTLALMKDPRSGPIAVTVLIVVLLLKLAALVCLLEQQTTYVLLLAPWLARIQLPVLFMTTPYVRESGLGSVLAAHLPRSQLPWVVVGHILLVLLFGWHGLLSVLLSLALLLWLRAQLLKRLGGTTGDTAGALVELTECAVLIGAAIW